jgi:hypothetical protein
MTIGIPNEGTVVVGVILGPKPRCAIIPPAREKRTCVEVPHGRAVRRAEAEMGALHRCLHPRFVRDRKFDTEGSRCGPIIGAAAAAEIDDTDQPKRLQRRVIESAATIDVADTE